MDGDITSVFVGNRRKAMKNVQEIFSREHFLLVNGKFLVSVFTDRSIPPPPPASRWINLRFSILWL